MYTTRKDKPINEPTLAVLRRLAAIAEGNGMAYFIIGATARDLLMTHVFGIDAGRATRDVDLAIALQDWSQFQAIKQEFIDSGDFQAGSQAHRLYYRMDVHGAAYPVDLIPFGQIEDDDHRIAWPPDMQIVMNVAGYKAALQTAIAIDVGEGVQTRVVSLPALAALKLLAWQDRGLEDAKDALDFYFLLRNYFNAGNVDRIYGEAASLLDLSGFDPDLAGAALLGYDLNRILDSATTGGILGMLAHPGQRDRLLLHMGRAGDAGIADNFLRQFESGMAMPEFGSA